MADRQKQLTDEAFARINTADPAGFEPVISSLTGTRVWPDYTTGPSQKKGTRHLSVRSGRILTDETDRVNARMVS